MYFELFEVNFEQFIWPPQVDIFCKVNITEFFCYALNLMKLRLYKVSVITLNTMRSLLTGVDRKNQLSKDVKIEFIGSRRKDVKAANQAAGY